MLTSSEVEKSLDVTTSLVLASIQRRNELTCSDVMDEEEQVSFNLFFFFLR